MCELLTILDNIIAGLVSATSEMDGWWAGGGPTEQCLQFLKLNNSKKGINFEAFELQYHKM